jgi:hypothetical protein
MIRTALPEETLPAKACDGKQVPMIESGKEL